MVDRTRRKAKTDVHPISISLSQITATPDDSHNMHPADPVNLTPIPPLIDSYVYHSELPSDIDGDWIMGIDEAGRGREPHPHLDPSATKLISQPCSVQWYTQPHYVL